MINKNLYYNKSYIKRAHMPNLILPFALKKNVYGRGAV